MRKRTGKVAAFLAGALPCLWLAGCRKDAALTTFHDEMDSFYESLSAATGQLEAIDPASESAADDLLDVLASMDQLFQEMAAISVPEEFANVEDLADEASLYMTEASALYAEAYADGLYDESIGQAAGENYTRAMKRVNYIAILLQGRIPEDEGVTVVEEETAVETAVEEKTTGEESPRIQNFSY